MKVYSSFCRLQLISKFNEEICFLLCVSDIFGKYTCSLPLKHRKGIKITNAFQNILNESNCKPNKILVIKGSEFYNRSMKSWLQDNNIETYSIYNEEIIN